MAYVQTYDRLFVCSLDQTAHAKTCGYWYTVSSRATACTAFAKKESLIKWAEDRGLTLPDNLPDPGTFSGHPIEGAFRVSLEMDPAAFYALDGQHVRVMDNGEYTLGIITLDDDGLRTVHKLNVNVRDRMTFPYNESRELVG
jgi:hypothetical protein